VHTTEIPRQKLPPDIEKAIVFHNGDWSGDAIFTWTDARGEEHEVQIPGALVQYISRRAVLDEVVSAIDSL
jgi:hypothetical protein